MNESLSLSLFFKTLTLSNSLFLLNCLWLVDSLLSFNFINILPLFLTFSFWLYPLVLACVGVGVGVGETWWDTINCFIVICECEFFWLAASSCDWGMGAMRLVSLSIEWGGGWMGIWHLGPGEIFEWGEVNAHGICANATNKQ